MVLFKFSDLIDIIERDNCLEFGRIVDNDFARIDSLAKQKSNSNLIHLCAKYNADTICEYILVKFNINYANSRDFEGKTPLHVACVFGSSSVANVLIFYGAEIDALKRGDWTALMISVSKVNLKLTKLFLTNGADLSLRNKDGWSAVHIAARTGNVDLMKLLCQHIKVNNLESIIYSTSNNGRTLLHIASIHGHAGLIHYFLGELGWNEVNLKDHCGVTPFMDAARANCVEICTRIKSISSVVNDVDNIGRSALHIAAQANSINVINYIVSELNFDINLQDIWKQTPLFLTIREGHQEATQLLINLGATIQLFDAQKRSPIDIARIYGHHALINLLI